MTRRGALLLEVLLSLALFVMASLAILGIVRDAVGRLDDTRARLEAADLAHTAIAAIEAGLFEPTALNGPVPQGGLLAEDDQDSGGVAAAPNPDDLWSLEIETEPSAFPGLAFVRVTAYRGDFDDPSASFSLRQLVPDRDNAAAGADALGGGAPR